MNSTFAVYANGIFWGLFEGTSAQSAMQAAADEHGTVDVGEEQASTEGMTAEEWKPEYDETLKDILA